MMENVDLPSAIRKVPFFAPLAESPTLYMVPNDFSFQGLIDIYKRDYTNNRPYIRVGTSNSQFMRSLYNIPLISLQNIDGVQFLNLMDQDYKRMYILDNTSDPNNGTWTAVGAATNVWFSTVHKIAGDASVTFNVPITTSTFGVSKSDFVQIPSLTDMAYITMYAYFPIYTSEVTIRYGQDSGNYDEITLDTDWQGNRFTVGWNTLVFDMSTATTTGVPWTDVTYFAYLINDDIAAAQSGYKINAIYLTEDYNFDLRYYSGSIITNSHGERIDNCLPTADSDIVIMNHREHALFVKQFAVISSIDTMVAGATNQYNAYDKKLQDAYEQFRMDYPSERILISTQW